MPDDDDLKDAVACYVESEVARRVDKDQATADKLYADYRLKIGDIIFREEADLRPRATRVCIEGLDQSELVQIYPSNLYPREVGETCAEPTGVEQVTSFLNTAQTFVAECPEGQNGDPAEVTIAAGAYSSDVSQEAADAAALAAATAQAQAALECTPVVSTPVLTLDPDSVSDNIPVKWTQGNEPGTNEIWKSVNGGAYTLVATVDGADTQWTDNAGMASGDIWCYKVRGINGAINGAFSNVGCAVKDLAMLDIGSVSHPTWMLAYGVLSFDDSTLVDSLDLSGLLYVEDGFALDVTTNLNSVNLNSLALVSGPFTFFSTALTALILPVLESVGGDLTFTFAHLTTLSLPALQTVNGDLECDSCLSLVSVSIPNLLMQNGRSYHFDNCALNAASVEGILARGVASAGITTATITLNSGTNAGLASLSPQGQLDYAALIGAGNSVSINP